MDSLERQVDQARERLVPSWDHERTGRVLQRIQATQIARRGRRTVAATALAAATLSSVIVWQVQRRETTVQRLRGEDPVTATAPAPVTAPTEVAPEPIALADGSEVTARPGAAVRVIKDEPNRIVLSLDAGSARFDVVPERSRLFRVRVDELDVTVLGTIFDVSRGDTEVEVTVERGRVRVSGPAGETHIDADESRSFDYGGRPTDGMSGFEPSEAALTDQDTNPAASSHSGQRSRRPRAWRSLAKAGDYEAAHSALHQGGRPMLPAHDPSALLDAADAARFSGYPEEGARYLSQFSKRHRDSPMAPMAAFTLGRVCLDQLGQPHRAARAFALAYKLAPSGSLAQDALAREVEALSKGGREHEAYLRAQDYVRRYPHGRRLRAVRLYGDLD